MHVFAMLQLEINWKPGKGELMLQYRVKHAAKCYSKIKSDEHGRLIDWALLGGKKFE